MPAPAHVVWNSLTQPRDPIARPWLTLEANESDPEILEGTRPTHVVWGGLWPEFADLRIEFVLAKDGSDTAVEVRVLSPTPVGEDLAGQLGHRISLLIFGNLRHSYGQ